MITKELELPFQACPLCQCYEWLEWEETRTLTDATLVSAYIYCSDCQLQISGESLLIASEKWNSLCKD